MQMQIWRYVWRENYAQTIVEFIDHQTTIIDSIQPEFYSFQRDSNHHHHVKLNSTSSPIRCVIL